MFEVYDLFLAEAFVLGKIITDLWSRPRLESNRSNITPPFIHLTFYVFAKLCSSQDYSGIYLENRETLVITWQLHRLYQSVTNHTIYQSFRYISKYSPLILNHAFLFCSVFSCILLYFTFSIFSFRELQIIEMKISNELQL